MEQESEKFIVCNMDDVFTYEKPKKPKNRMPRKYKKQLKIFLCKKYPLLKGVKFNFG